jgi:hypothetical protein
MHLGMFTHYQTNQWKYGKSSQQLQNTCGPIVSHYHAALGMFDHLTKKISKMESSLPEFSPVLQPNSSWFQECDLEFHETFWYF